MLLVSVEGPRPAGQEFCVWAAADGTQRFMSLAELPNSALLDNSGVDGDATLWVGRQLWPSGDEVAPSDARALLSVAQEPAPGHEEDFYNWLEQEHLPALACVSGVLAARRYIAIMGAPRFLALYYLATVSVVESKEWVEAGTSAWGDRLLPYRMNRIRGLFARDLRT